eukprot:CCRYP_020202-RA/>CCRYP_020202-RA protein AED:0.22 eAED:0.25 QI:1501/0/0.5/1/0/0/2/0/162
MASSIPLQIIKSKDWSSNSSFFVTSRHWNVILLCTGFFLNSFLAGELSESLEKCYLLALRIRPLANLVPNLNNDSSFVSYQLLLLLSALTVTIHPSTALDWRARRDRLLGIKRKKKGSKAGWKQTKTRAFSKKDEKWEWQCLDLLADAGLRVGVKYRPKDGS